MCNWNISWRWIGRVIDGHILGSNCSTLSLPCCTVILSLDVSLTYSDTVSFRWLRRVIGLHCPTKTVLIYVNWNFILQTGAAWWCEIVGRELCCQRLSGIQGWAMIDSWCDGWTCICLSLDQGVNAGSLRKLGINREVWPHSRSASLLYELSKLSALED